jgi:hypothetical protein
MAKCDRCSKEVHATEDCAYCKRAVCERCKKSAKHVKKTLRLAICKDCWTNIKTRKKFLGA